MICQPKAPFADHLTVQKSSITKAPNVAHLALKTIPGRYRAVGDRAVLTIENTNNEYDRASVCMK
jgi:hypothetical protein